MNMTKTQRPIWFQNWRYPGDNHSLARVLNVIATSDRYFKNRMTDPDWDLEYKFIYDNSAAKTPEESSALTTREGSPKIEDNFKDAPDNIIGLPKTISDSTETNLMQDSTWVLFHILSIPITGEKLAYASIILLITIVLISSSLLIICTLLASGSYRDIVGNYLISLSVNDLLWSTLITPLSGYAAIQGDDWTFDQDGILCKFGAYFEIMLFTCMVYTFMWIGVDRYAALTRPSRYETEQSVTRCKCWIIFTWITSALLCCPPLFGEQNQARRYKEAFMCVLDWAAVAPYSITLGVLVTVPSLISVLYTYSFIFRNLRNPEKLEDNQKTLLDNDPTYVMTFFALIAFAVSWAPYFALQAVESLSGVSLKSKILHFTFVWLAIGGLCWKFAIYCSVSREFRLNLLRTLRCNGRKKTTPKLTSSVAASNRSKKRASLNNNNCYGCNSDVVTASKDSISLQKNSDQYRESVEI